MPKMSKSNSNKMVYATYVPAKKQEEPVDIWAKYRQMIADDPIQVALQNGTLSWADTLDPDPEPTEEDIARFRTAQKEADKRKALEKMEARLAHVKEDYDLVIRQLNNRRAALLIAQQHLEDYYEGLNMWLSSNDEYLESDPDEMGMGWESHWQEQYDDWYKHATKDIHRDANGEPEICRYFSSPGGCNLPNGKKCPYKHIAGAAPEPCRFFSTPRGCNKGSSCPFSHPTTANTASNWRQTSSTQSHQSSTQSHQSSTQSHQSSTQSHQHSDSSSVASGGSWVNVSRRSPAPVEQCRFFKSARGCNKGSACPYKH